MMKRPSSTAPAAAAPSASDQRWAAVVARDPACDGAFYYSVVTTGVYCRPSCPARRAKREHVHFHATCDEAEAAGFRPCRRCKPRETGSVRDDVARVTRACRLIEAADELPTLAELSVALGLSPFHFHRLFKTTTGVTPKAFAEAHRRNRVQASLERSRTVTEAIHEAGFGSSGRFYAKAAATLGMTPMAYRTGGDGIEIRFAVSRCSLGAILVAATQKGIAAILFGEAPGKMEHELRSRFPKARLVSGDRRFGRLVAKVIAFVEEPDRSFDLPLDIRGTAFQQRVWDALRSIPPGATASYSELARRIGEPKSVRAVARACAANAIAVAIPCHRVVAKDGSLAGYRWGIARKQALLEKERKR